MTTIYPVHTTAVRLNDEELQAVIDFNEEMAQQATDSCEEEEASQRKSRIVQLRKMQQGICDIRDPSPCPNCNC